MLGEWWIREHKKGSNAALRCSLLLRGTDPPPKKNTHTKHLTKIKTSDMGNSFSSSFSNRHYCLVFKNVNIWISSLCALLYAVTEWMGGGRLKCIQMALILNFNPNIPHHTWYHSVYKEHILNTWIIINCGLWHSYGKKYRIKDHNFWTQNIQTHTYEENKTVSFSCKVSLLAATNFLQVTTILHNTHCSHRKELHLIRWLHSSSKSSI